MIGRLAAPIFRAPQLARLRRHGGNLINGLLWPVNARRRADSHDLRAFEQRVYSQHGEDGILCELFFRLGVRTGTFAEMSVAD